MKRRYFLLLLLFGITALLLFVIIAIANREKVVAQQEQITSYHDTGTNGQQILLKDKAVINAVDLSMYANSWDKQKAKSKGSDVLLLIIDSRDNSLISCGVINRHEVPLEKGIWVRCRLHRKAQLQANVQYVLKVIEVSSGGEMGWNEYGFAKGDKYPDGNLINDFTSREKMDYAFRLINQ